MSPIKNNPRFMVGSWFYEDNSNFQPHYIKPLNLLLSRKTMKVNEIGELPYGTSIISIYLWEL